MILVMFEKIFAPMLTKKVAAYQAAHPEVRRIVIVGTLGESSTKQAIASVMAKKFRVRMHEAAPLDSIDVAAGFFGVERPHGFGEWWRAVKAASVQCKQPPFVDVVIQNIPVSSPGVVAQAATLLHPDIAVITGVDAGHLQQFASTDALAQEVFSVTGLAQYVLINRDDIDAKYASLEQSANFNTYGSAGAAEYRIVLTELDQVMNTPAKIIAVGLPDPVDTTVQVIGEHMTRPLAAAVAVGLQSGMSSADISDAISHVTPLSGRMNPLRGVDGTTVIDDTHSMDTDSSIAALQTLYQFKNSAQRLALLGSMYDLAGETQLEHQKIGDVCSPDWLEWIVTVGQPSADFLAPVAREHGCQVRSFATAIEAVEFVRSVTQPGAVILAKGSPEDELSHALENLVDLTEHHKLTYFTHASGEIG